MVSISSSKWKSVLIADYFDLLMLFEIGHYIQIICSGLSKTCCTLNYFVISAYIALKSRDGCLFYLFIFKKAHLFRWTLPLFRLPLVRSPVTLNTCSAKACDAGKASTSSAQMLQPWKNCTCAAQNAMPFSSPQGCDSTCLFFRSACRTQSPFPDADCLCIAFEKKWNLSFFGDGQLGGVSLVSSSWRVL